MSKEKDRSGSIMLLDMLCILVTTFGIPALIAQLSGSLDLNVFIVSLFFFGAKLLVIGIGDVTDASRKVVFGILFALIANGVVFALNQIVGFGVSNFTLGIGAVCDIVFALTIRLIFKQ